MLDTFDRESSTYLGFLYTEINGDWWVYSSSEPKYVGDGALYELSGNGKVSLRVNFGPMLGGWGVSFNTIDELPNQRYLVTLCETTPGGGGITGEYFTGDATNSVLAYVQIGGEKVEFSAIGCNSQYGRVVSVSYVENSQLACITVTHKAEHASAQASCVGKLDGKFFSIENASGTDGNGDPIPIEVDELAYVRHENPEGPAGSVCFSCLCVCKNTPESTIEYAYPALMNVHVTGGCRTKDPVMPDCDLDDCPWDTDLDVQVVWDYKYPASLPGCWHGTYGDCGGTFELRLRCLLTGRLDLEVWWKGPGDLNWNLLVSTNTPPGAYVFGISSHSCNPLKITYGLGVGTASGWPCCCSCTIGSYTYEVTGDLECDPYGT